MIKFAFGVIFLLALFLLAFYLRKHRRISNLILLFATCFGLLFIIESIYRAFIRKPSVHTISYLPMVKDTILGLRIERAGVFPALNIDEYGDTVFNVKYTVIDDTLMNGPASPIRTGFRNEQRQNEVVFIGCSFTFGIGLNDHETLPFQFGTLTQISSVNRGVGSYGIHQVYESFRLKYGNKDNHRRVFVYSLLPDHFIRATGIYEWNNYGPYFSIEGDKLINEGVKEISNEKKKKRIAGLY